MGAAPLLLLGALLLFVSAYAAGEASVLGCKASALLTGVSIRQPTHPHPVDPPGSQAHGLLVKWVHKYNGPV